MSGRDERGLAGRVAVVTGVSRRRGIGCAIASRLVARGVNLLVTHRCSHDAEQPWGDDDVEAVLAQLRSHRADPSQQVLGIDVDLADPQAPDEVLR